MAQETDTVRRRLHRRRSRSSLSANGSRSAVILVLRLSERDAWRHPAAWPVIGTPAVEART
ncbi:hypothetical protein [Amycolatopsis lurida]|uniref:Uncharacterized protein n=1 Tax=Amycolatopsis lurida NRRL 2430 TaxID=1460371 RepID=A0A2P2FGL7_AMYLU|nr:hypothetical protein [Amycolatopsis lurida]KFU75829.1 hypothetical protein BB31_39210 [Amycolatopsis lurida NRRL 2430]